MKLFHKKHCYLPKEIQRHFCNFCWGKEECLSSLSCWLGILTFIFKKGSAKRGGFVCALRSLALVLSKVMCKAGGRPASDAPRGCEAFLSITAEIQRCWDPDVGPKAVPNGTRTPGVLPAPLAPAFGGGIPRGRLGWGSPARFAEHLLQRQASNQCTKQNCLRYL